MNDADSKAQQEKMYQDGINAGKLIALPVINQLKAKVAEQDREIERLQAEQAAAVCAWEELAHVPGIKPIVYGIILKEDGTTGKLALKPEQIGGLLEAIEKQVRGCLPFGVQAVEARQKIDGVRHRAKKAEAELIQLRKYNDVLQSQRADVYKEGVEDGKREALQHKEGE